MTTLKTRLVCLVVALLAAALAHAQIPPPPPPPGSPPAALTAADLAKVKTVLAPYKSANLNGKLSADDAKAIKRALRDAGMRRSRELDAALLANGFNADKLDQLDPPPARPPEGAPPPKK